MKMQEPCQLDTVAEFDELQEMWYPWLAGIIDGEGCVSIRTDRCTPVVSIGNTNRAMLDKVVQVVGFGKVNGPYKHDPQKYPNSKDWYSLVYGKPSEVSDILFMIRPWLVVKGEQADLVEASIQTDDLQEKQALLASIRKLNHRGPA